MPWVKGQSGNTKGRPKAATMLARLARSKTRDGLDLIEFALRIMNGTEREKAIRFIKNGDGERIQVEVELPPSLEDRMDAMKWLADRGWGKAVETIELIEEPQPPTAIVPSDAELEEGLAPSGSVQ